MLIKCSHSVQKPEKSPSFSGDRSQNLPITSQFHALQNEKTNAIIPSRLVERHIAPGGKTKLFTLNFGGVFIMKNTFAKNLIKSMENYGELLNRVGC